MYIFSLPLVYMYICIAFTTHHLKTNHLPFNSSSNNTMKTLPLSLSISFLTPKDSRESTSSQKARKRKETNKAKTKQSQAKKIIHIFPLIATLTPFFSLCPIPSFPPSPAFHATTIMNINLSSSSSSPDPPLPPLFLPFPSFDHQQQSNSTTSTFNNYNYNYMNCNYTDHLMPMSTIPAFTANFSVKPDHTDQSLGGIGIGSTCIGLNLGHRTYFSSGEASAIDRLFARSRGVYSLSHQPPRCQAEGCKADLSIAKHYHKRHKVCEFHSKATIVIAGGLQQRFCQQCSRFHVLSEFDESKRSCRKRLADHNRRRRKPQPQKNKQVMISTTENTILRMEGLQEGYKKKGVFGFEFEFESSNLYQNQVSFVSHEQQQQQQQHHQEKFFSSPNTSTSLLHDHNFFCSASSGGSEQQDEHHQAMFEVEFM